MKIVIIGGGAGGLELATKLGKKLGCRGKADVLLVDRNQTHIWKPLLHEVASGSLDADVDAVGYRAHAHDNGFTFKLGCMTGLDIKRKQVFLEALLDDDGREILPKREESYDYLVLAIGSVSNDFSVPGVAQHCIFLDSPLQAQRFHKRLLYQFIRLNRELSDGESKRQLRVAIVGGGATGVELSAELYKAREWFSTYGLRHISAAHLSVTLIEAGARLLPALTEHISNGVKTELSQLGVNVRLDTAIVKVTESGLFTADNEEIPADLMVWAAGVKAPDFLNQIEGLETNRANQILVEPSLLAQGDDSIFVLGDCAGLRYTTADGSERWVPPRAQSAHQMAATVANNLVNLCSGKALEDFRYNDLGSLVSLSEYTAFGRLMGGLARGGLSLEGKLARLAYVSLYRMHQVAIYGWVKMLVLAFTDKINHFIRPKFKLH